MLNKYDRAGFSVQSVDSSEACLARLDEEERFDLLLLDYGLPGQDGLALLRHLRASPARRP
jgi:CheY-like chemotaxis protein